MLFVMLIAQREIFVAEATRHIIFHFVSEISRDKLKEGTLRGDSKAFKKIRVVK